MYHFEVHPVTLISIFAIEIWTMNIELFRSAR